MPPRPTPVTQPDREATPASPGRLVSALIALVLVAGIPGLVGAAPAAALAAPSAVSLSVVAGPTRGGTVVDLSGSGVGATTKVLFGTTTVTRVTRVSSTKVRVVTPAHAAGLVSVRVATPTGFSPVASRSTFAFDAVPTLGALSSRSASTRGGTTVTLTGTGLQRTSSVHFGTTAASGLTRISATQVRVTVPAHTAGTVDVRVTTPGGTSSVTGAGRFSYTAPPVGKAPTVTSLSVPAGPVRGGTVIVVGGTDFTGTTHATFGGTTAGFTVLSSTQLRVTAPARPAGLVNVQVRTAAGLSPASAANAYSYEAIPTLTGASPASGPTTGGTLVTLTGTGLGRATAVQFGTTTTTQVVRVSATTLRVTSPAGATGTVDVRVVTPGGSSPVSTGVRHTYQAAPAVTSLSTTAGPLQGGTTVILTGARFSGASRVVFGATTASFTVVSATTIRAVAPAHVAGAVAVSVTTPYGTSPTSTSATYAYDPVPSITALSPQTGPRAGGTVVTLTGTGLTRASAVRFGAATATNLVRVSPTTLRVTTPAHATGPVDVAVTTPGGTSAATSATRYAYGHAPVVSGLSVTAGPLGGGTVVTITGTDLAEATQVRLGSVPASGLVRVSDTTLQATAPAQAEGTVVVLVSNANGTSAATDLGRYTYVGIPAVTALSTRPAPWAARSSPSPAPGWGLPRR